VRLQVPWDVRLRADPAVDQDAFRSFVEADPRAEPVPGEPKDETWREVRVVGPQVYTYAPAAPVIFGGEIRR
jgi:hypothetical protein